MKYCTKCGAELDDGTIVCPRCGNEERPAQIVLYEPQKPKTSGLRTAAKIMMLFGCIASAFLFLIPLCWTIPMTVIYWKKTAANQPVGTGFKICSLLFVNTIAGILMLCDEG